MANELKDKEIQVGDSKIGMSSKVTMNVKTALAVLGIFGSILTWGYLDTKSDIKELSNSISSTEKTILLKMEKDINEKLRLRDMEISNELTVMSGDIKVLLDRTSGNRRYNNSRLTIRNNTPPPESVTDSTDATITINNNDSIQ